ncbi:hypothetical protein, partial [Allofournierella sp.]|uniref:hypothetical protein n=1 Tax=Allofournierella sp. TaxID=1940256 RepID=UPI003AB5E175
MAGGRRGACGRRPGVFRRRPARLHGGALAFPLSSFLSACALFSVFLCHCGTSILAIFINYTPFSNKFQITFSKLSFTLGKHKIKTTGGGDRM